MNRKKVLGRVTAAVVAFVMAVSLAACGGGQGGSSSGGDNNGSKTDTQGSGASMPEITIKDGVVRSSQIVLSDSEISTEGLQILAEKDGWIYGANNNYEGFGDDAFELVRFKTDGTGYEKIDYSINTDDQEISAITFYGDCYYLAVSEISNSPALDYELSNLGETGDVTDFEIPDELSEDASSTYRICCVTMDGKEKWTSQIEESLTSDYYYINAIEGTEKGIMVSSSNGVSCYSPEDGSLVEKVCEVSEEQMTGILYVLKDGTVILQDDMSSNIKISEYDASTGKFTDRLSLPPALSGSTLFPGVNYDLYLASEDGIYGADLGSDKLTPVVNFVNSDLDIQGIVRAIEIENGRLLVQVYGTSFTLDTYLLEPVAPEDVQEKKELTLGGHYIDYEVRSEIIKFNKESNDYRIRILDYSQYDLEGDDYNNPTGMTRLSTDIVTGNAPDIMLLSEQMPVESYISKGVFEDLTDRFENDEEIDKDDFLQNVLDAFKTNGRMYVLVPGFGVTGVSGKAKYIGDGKDLSIKKIREIAASKGISDSQIFGIADRETILTSAIEFSGNQFIDRESGTCSFDTDDFRELLEFVNLFPEEISEEQMMDYSSPYLGDRALLSIQYVNTLYDYDYMTRQMFGDLDVSVTGFPSRNNIGPAVSAPIIQLAVNSSASDPDGCWSFVRRFMLPAYQESMESCFPISEKAIDVQGKQMIEAAKKQQEEYEMYIRENFGADTEIVEGITSLEDDTSDEDDIPDLADEASTGAAAQEADEDVYESEDLTGKPMAEENFDGTPEEYQEYLENFEADQALSEDSEEVIIDGADAAAAEDVYGLSSLPLFNEKDVEAVKKMLKGLTFTLNGESEILNIVSEESAAYFAGQKSVEEVSDIIQSRVQVYMHENE